MGIRERNNEDPLFSIIIPCKEKEEARKCVEECRRYEDCGEEIMVVDDKTCAGLPADKRNWAMARAKGKYLAFIDSDGYPSYDWLSAARYFLAKGYSAVCGAGIIPPNSPILERASDLILRHLPCSYRVVRKRPSIVSEFPTFNLIVRADRAPKFKPYLTGEDSLFCKELEGDIYYHPNIFVYHRRRPLFKPLMKQLGTYGRHRGHFLRLALIGWVMVVFTYIYNFIRGFCANTLSSK